MSNVVSIKNHLPVPANNSIDDPNWASLTAAQRSEALLVKSLLEPILPDIEKGGSARKAAKLLHSKITNRALSPELLTTAKALSRRDEIMSWKTLDRWIGKYKKGGLVALAPGYKGRQTKRQDWHLRARHFLTLPSKPDCRTVRDWLLDEGFDVTYHQVYAFWKSLPASEGELAPTRVGANYHRHNLARHKTIDDSKLAAGVVWQGDGHTIDVYLAHPATGQPFRPELTAFLDAKSRFIVGWSLSEGESALSTHNTLVLCVAEHDDVPGMLHTDPGSGFDNKIIQDFCEQLSIYQRLAIAGNAKGKGRIERWFRTVRDRHDKKFSTYCGHDMADESNRTLKADVNSGKKTLPTLAQYEESISQFIDRYNITPHSALEGESPKSLWDARQRSPLNTNISALMMTRKCVVRRSRITFDKRQYEHPELAKYLSQTVRAQFSKRSDALVRITDLEGRWICDAPIVKRSPNVPDSHLQQIKQKRLEGQIKRKQRQIDEDKKRARLSIDHTHHLEGLQAAGALDDIDNDVLDHDDTGIDLDLDMTDIKKADAEIHIDPYHTDY